MSPRELFGSTLLATGSETARSRSRTLLPSFAIAFLVLTAAALVAYH